MKRKKPQLAYTVSGPNVDASYAEPGPALSRAITAAEAAKEQGSFYVRDVFDKTIYRVTRTSDRHVLIYSLAR